MNRRLRPIQLRPFKTRLQTDIQRDMEEERKWEELNTDCLVNVLERVGLESLLLAVPFVCKSWYRASLNPDCWKILHFPDEFSLEPWIGDYNPTFRPRFMDVYRLENFSFTGVVKIVVSRSRRFAVRVALPGVCRSEVLKFLSSECPSLKDIVLPFLLVQTHGQRISKLVSKWKDLQQLHLGSTKFLTEILNEISLNCKNFNGLSVKGYVGNEEALAIATLVPKIKYLWLRVKLAMKNHQPLQMILEGCKEMVLLDARDCDGLEAEDEEVLKMASHIKTFMVEGSRL